MRAVLSVLALATPAFCATVTLPVFQTYSTTCQLNNEPDVCSVPVNVPAGSCISTSIRSNSSIAVEEFTNGVGSAQQEGTMAAFQSCVSGSHKYVGASTAPTIVGTTYDWDNTITLSFSIYSDPSSTLAPKSPFAADVPAASRFDSGGTSTYNAQSGSAADNLIWSIGTVLADSSVLVVNVPYMTPQTSPWYNMTGLSSTSGPIPCDPVPNIGLQACNATLSTLLSAITVNTELSNAVGNVGVRAAIAVRPWPLD